MYYYVYVLECSDGFWYTGYTKDIRIRLEENNKGQVESTKRRIPAKLIYFEGCMNQQDATKREKYLKTTYGKRYIRNRLNNYFTGWIYQRALEIEMAKQNLNFEREKEMFIYYDSYEIGTRRVDFFVEEKIMVELKALTQLEKVHPVKFSLSF